MFGWLSFVQMINALLLNVPMYFVWSLMTAGWKKFGTYSCGDKLAKLVLIIAALAYSGIAILLLVMQLIKYWANDNYDEFYSFLTFFKKIEMGMQWLRFFYCCLILLVTLWAMCDVHKSC